MTSILARFLQIVELALDLRNSHELRALFALQITDMFIVLADGLSERIEFRLERIDPDLTAIGPATAISTLASISRPPVPPVFRRHELQTSKPSATVRATKSRETERIDEMSREWTS